MSPLFEPARYRGRTVDSIWSRIELSNARSFLNFQADAHVRFTFPH